MVDYASRDFDMDSPNNKNCLIWPDYEARAVETDSAETMITVYESARTGGDYRLAPRIARRLNPRRGLLDYRGRARLTTMLIELRSQGDLWPEVTFELITKAQEAIDLPVHARAVRLLRHLSRLTVIIGQGIDTTPHSGDFPGLLAWTESTEESEIAFLEDYLRNQGWLEGDPGSPIVSVDGYARLAAMSAGQDSDQVFVAMWFSDEMKRIYSEAIEPAIRATDLTPYLVGQGKSTDRIDDEAEAAIRRSRLVIADFTHDPEDSVRGSVYYEAGFARALNIPYIFTAKEGSDVHFNVNHFLRIEWKDADDLRTKLTHRIRNLPELQKQR